MKNKTINHQLDNYDLKILAELQKNGRIAIADLAQKIGLSTTPCWRRVHRLQDSGIIQHYAAVIDPAVFGINLDVFIEVSLDLHLAKTFEQTIMERDEIIECYAITGGQDYMLHVMVTDIASYDIFLREELIHFPGVQRVKTHLALNPIKKSSGLLLKELNK
ncbi:MAG: AsnC family transcriptional regulator [Gammaproteobacteria bacterium]|nr:MAG: AsnC family transcriptional regulator [Gammaproteobacteria bacterium]